jgi:hypothetical protein
MIGNFTVIGSTSNIQPIANKDEKFLLKNENRFSLHAQWMMGISVSISRITKPAFVKKFSCAVARV